MNAQYFAQPMKVGVSVFVIIAFITASNKHIYRKNNGFDFLCDGWYQCNQNYSWLDGMWKRHQERKNSQPSMINITRELGVYLTIKPLVWPRAWIHTNWAKSQYSLHIKFVRKILLAPQIDLLEGNWTHQFSGACFCKVDLHLKGLTKCYIFLSPTQRLVICSCPAKYSMIRQLMSNLDTWKNRSSQSAISIVQSAPTMSVLSCGMVTGSIHLNSLLHKDLLLSWLSHSWVLTSPPFHCSYLLRSGGGTLAWLCWRHASLRFLLRFYFR